MTDAPRPSASPFERSFSRLAKTVRRSLAARTIVSAAAIGLTVGVVAAGAAWYQRSDRLRPAAAGLGLVGAAVGAVVARRRRMRDEDVALYLDARLGSDEAIATALELEQRGERTSDGDAALSAVVVAHANEALSRATPREARPAWLRREHALAPLAAAAIAALSLAPLPPAPPEPPPPPGSEIVRLGEVKGLDKLAKVDQLSARDPAQKKRLEKLAKDARKLRERLREGVERREAQAEIARLAEGLAAEQLSLGEGEERAGLESALGKLAENTDLKGVERALGDRDLVRVDEEMQKLANRLEAEDRKKAKETLEKAIEEAKKAKAPDVAKALEEQKKRLEEQGKRADAARELAKQLDKKLSPEAKKALEDAAATGDPRAQRELAKALEKALEELTPEERKGLAERIEKEAERRAEEQKKQAREPGKQPGDEGDKSGKQPGDKGDKSGKQPGDEGDKSGKQPGDKGDKSGKQPGEEPDEEPGAGGMSPEELRELAKELGTPEGQRELAEKLKDLAKEPPPSKEAERQRELGKAQKELGEGQKQLGGAPLPVPGAGTSAPKPGEKPGDKPGKKPGDKPGEKPGKKPGDKPGDKPGKKPGEGPGDKPGDEPGETPGEGGEDPRSGPSRGGKSADHQGSTGKVDGPGVTAKADGKLGKGKLLPGSSVGRGKGRVGETANVQGVPGLGGARALEVGGVERSEVPDEYKKHVGRYFDPR